MRSLNALARVELINLGEHEIRPLEPGRLMARFYIAYDTMNNFSAIKGDEELSELIKIIAKSKEFSDVMLRRNEKVSLNMLNSDKHKKTVRFPLPGKVKDNVMKTVILMQAILGCLHIADPSLSREALKIVQTGSRLGKCLVEFIWSRQNTDGCKALKSACLLSKSLNAGIWNNSEFVSKQFDRVGIAYSTNLVHAGYTTFGKIAEANPRELELVLNKQAPFGNHLRDCALHMPEYDMKVEQIGDKQRSKAVIRISVTLANVEAIMDRSTANNYHTCYLIIGNHRNEILVKAKIKDLLLKQSSYKRVLTVECLPGKALKPVLNISWISERYAGLDISHSFQPVFMSDFSNLRTQCWTTNDAGDIVEDADDPEALSVQDEYLDEKVLEEMDCDWNLTPKSAKKPPTSKSKTISSKLANKKKMFTFKDLKSLPKPPENFKESAGDGIYNELPSPIKCSPVSSGIARGSQTPKSFPRPVPKTPGSAGNRQTQISSFFSVTKRKDSPSQRKLIPSTPKASSTTVNKEKMRLPATTNWGQGSEKINPAPLKKETTVGSHGSVARSSVANHPGNTGISCKQSRDVTARIVTPLPSATLTSGEFRQASMWKSDVTQSKSSNKIIDLVSQSPEIGHNVFLPSKEEISPYGSHRADTFDFKQPTAPPPPPPPPIFTPSRNAHKKQLPIQSPSVQRTATPARLYGGPPVTSLFPDADGKRSWDIGNKTAASPRKIENPFPHLGGTRMLATTTPCTKQGSIYGGVASSVQRQFPSATTHSSQGNSYPARTNGDKENVNVNAETGSYHSSQIKRQKTIDLEMDDQDSSMFEPSSNFRSQTTPKRPRLLERFMECEDDDAPRKKAKSQFQYQISQPLSAFFKARTAENNSSNPDFRKVVAPSGANHFNDEQFPRNPDSMSRIYLDSGNNTRQTLSPIKPGTIRNNLMSSDFQFASNDDDSQNNYPNCLERRDERRGGGEDAEMILHNNINNVSVINCDVDAAGNSKNLGERERNTNSLLVSNALQDFCRRNLKGFGRQGTEIDGGSSQKMMSDGPRQPSQSHQKSPERPFSWTFL